MSQAENLHVIEGDGSERGGADDPLVGQTIDGRYVVEKVLGEGGMGLVYKAKHTVLGKPLALKVLRPDVSKDEEIMTRFRQEAQSASSIGNEHIIDISDFGTLEDGSTYFIMEFLDGIDLTGAIEQETPMGAARVIHITRQMCRALAAAHEIGIVHRDLKPDNIFLIRRGGDENFVKVLDFGIAKVGGNASKLTRAGQVFGTPHYMSPEQCSGSGVDHRTDIYALGIMMYEMATGRVPFDADNLMGILTKHLYEEAVPPRQINPDLPEGLETVIFRCITKNADERYQTMAEVMADLDQLDAGVAPAARPDPAGRQAVAMASTQEMQAAAVGGRSKLLPIGLGVGAFALAGVATAFFLGSGDSALPPAPAGSFEKQAQAAVSAEMAAVEAEVEAESEKGKAEDAQTEEEGALDTDRVAVQSEPPEAQVFLGEDLIGNAPVKIPRPNKDEKVTLELRASGHQTQSVRISHLTAESVKVTLEKEKEKRSRRWGRRSAKQRKAAKQANKQQPKADKPTEKPAEKPKSKPKSGGGSSLPQTEVLDPWKN